MSRLIDLKGQRFGRLVALEIAGQKGNGNKLWLCQCDCGNTCIKDGYNLRHGITKSCGCLVKDVAREKFYQQEETRQRMGNVEQLASAWHVTYMDKVRSTNQSGTTGVSYDSMRDRWVARLYYNHRYVLNRTFKTKEEAVEARVEAERQYLKVN
ncbi:hypothetical protein [Levilactobacillus bambusae]|uniref:AP2 domain-containing protein n=1 Tax=Levilactobacillus bambusae TaxID=2024736 RepID=A0A2V1MX56_9LACO|nr:hypothetical protein [Levilactobacillus bambusae]PWF99650.1 hypothetical protein DCM90_07490 [Levilactobacillus bambusae]